MDMTGCTVLPLSRFILFLGGEVRQGMGEDGSRLTCPKCQAGNPKKLLSIFFNSSSSTFEPSDIFYPTCSTGTCGLPSM